jgi:hypothetical protein
MCSAAFTEHNFVLLQKYSFVHRNELQQYSLQLYVRQRQFTRKKKKEEEEEEEEEESHVAFQYAFHHTMNSIRYNTFKLNKYDKKGCVAEGPCLIHMQTSQHCKHSIN